MIKDAHVGRTDCGEPLHGGRGIGKKVPIGHQVHELLRPAQVVAVPVTVGKVYGLLLERRSPETLQELSPLNGCDAGREVDFTRDEEGEDLKDD